VNLNKTLMTFLKKALKVLLIVLAAIAILSETGTNVTTIITGLGLGGLTFALAAQDTAQNLFGGLVILLDKPFAVDDWISTPNIEGVVEDITFRSTRIRTFPNALVVVPNSSLVSSPITNWSRMNKRRATFSIGLTYDTPKEKMEECVARITEMVNSNEEILPEDTVIRFNSFQDSSLEISLMYFTRPTSFSDFQRIKEQVNYGIMQIVEDLGLSFAFPTQTLYVHPDK
ncbi:MAG: mechanosensitive ion channel family protein, partial [Negativibacillus sp.]